MKSVTAQLPTILGSLAAMLVAFLSLINGTSPGTCLAKAGAAFLVFSGFGLILRFAVSESVTDIPEIQSRSRVVDHAGNNLDVIVPGTSVAELLGVSQDEHATEDAS